MFDAWSYGPQNFAALSPIAHIWNVRAANASPNFSRQRTFDTCSCWPQNFAACAYLLLLGRKSVAKLQPMVDWCSGLTSRLGLQLGGGAAGSIPGSAFVFCGGENVCVHSLCMGFGVHTAL